MEKETKIYSVLSTAAANVYGIKTVIFISHDGNFKDNPKSSNEDRNFNFFSQ